VRTLAEVPLVLDRLRLVTALLAEHADRLPAALNVEVSDLCAELWIFASPELGLPAVKDALDVLGGLIHGVPRAVPVTAGRQHYQVDGQIGGLVIRVHGVVPGKPEGSA